MQEWDVIGVIVVLITLLSAVIAPIVKLTQAIAKLTVAMEHVEKNLDCFSARNRTAHERIWEYAQEQTAQINDHESRIRVIEET